MKNSLLILSLFILVISCANPKPRKPVAHTGGLDLSQSIELNKLLFEQEVTLFKKYIQKDSLHHYTASQYGFWYTYEVQKQTDSITSTKGDEVSFLYSIKDINDQSIYSQKELGEKTYLVDQQDFMQGIQEGIKLMKVDEKVIFLLPSYKAYAVYGDGNKIKPNTPLIVTVELTSIRKQ